MRLNENVRRSIALALAVSMCGATALGQSAAPAQDPAPAAQPTFEPEVGQAGKDVVWVPTPQALVDKMLDMAAVTPKDFVMDLGSGDGRTVITAAKRGATAVGIEYNPEMVELSKRNAAAEGVTARATFRQADLFETDFSKATVITMFLLPSINMQLRPKLLDLRPGTRIVSNSFSMEDWEADETASVEGDCTSWCTALLWIVPAKVAGTWKLPDGTLELQQTFQNLSGALNGTLITDGKVRGDQVTFTVGSRVYQARVSGSTMRSTEGVPWTGTRAPIVPPAAPGGGKPVPGNPPTSPSSGKPPVTPKTTAPTTVPAR